MAKPAQQNETTMDSVPYYEKWQKKEGIPILDALFIPDLKEDPLAHWDRIGQPATFDNM